MKKWTLLKLVAAIVVAGMAIAPSPAVSAVTYDLVTDWNNNTAPYANPNGQWAYLQGTTPLPAVSWGSSYAFAPNNISGNFLPAFWNGGDNITTHSVDGYNGNPSLGQSTLTWTALAAGTISITGEIWNPHGTNLDRTNTFTLSLGGATLKSGTVNSLAQYDENHAVSFSFTGLTVGQGEVLSLVNVANQDAGTESAIKLAVTENPVPLPAGILLLAPGLAGLAAIRRRFKK